MEQQFESYGVKCQVRDTTVWDLHMFEEQFYIPIGMLNEGSKMFEMLSWRISIRF